MANKLIHKRSSVITDNKPKLPQVDGLEFGEIAINYADGYETISFKNTENEIVEVRTREYFEDIINENEEAVSKALNDLNTRVDETENAYAAADNALKVYVEGLVDGLDIPTNLSELTNDVPFVTQGEFNSLYNSMESKQDAISDLATIRSGAALGATALQSVPSEYVTEGELSDVATSGSYNDLTDKPVIPSIDGLATVTYVNQEIGKIQNSSYDDTEIKNQLANKADKSELFSKSYNDLTDKPTIPAAVTESTVSGWGFTKNTGTYSKPSSGIPKSDLASAVQTSLGKADTALQSYTEQYQGTVEAVDTTESIDGVSNDFVTSEQLDARDYATNTNVNSQIQEVNEVVNEHSSRMDRIENYVEPSVRSQILWLGTSIPSGDAVNQPNNNYPKMVAEALGCTVYNNARAGSIVSWYPNAPTWTTSANVDAEFATGYCLSASKNDLRTKYYNVLETIRRNEGLSTSWRDNWLEDFYDKSYENLIIPYIDGTIASCDTVIIDHGFNDRHNIFDVCRQHPHTEDNLSKWPPEQVGGADVTYPVNNGNDGWFWLTHLADNRYYDGEVYMNTLRALAAAGDGSMRGEYFGAMAFIIEVIRKINPRVRIIIGNYFSLDHGFDAMSSFQTKYILQANQSIADYYGFHIVNVYKRTGLRNYSFTDNSGVTTTDMIRFCPDGVHPASDTTGLSNKIIAGIYLNELKGSLYI